ncbi:MAG: hypothetical protein ACKO6F_07090 [Cyanobium sp.]
MLSSPIPLSRNASGRTSSSHAAPVRRYRLVDEQGAPHPVLDDLYESLEAAWAEAQSWWQEVAPGQEPVGIGVEVSTACGDWRTLRHAGS